MPEPLLLDDLAELPAEEPFPGVTRHRLDTEHATVTRYAFAPGARFPTHRHDEEQITFVDEGSVVVRLPDGELRLGRGGCAVIPGGVPHGITAEADGGRITAVIVPRRGAGDRYEVLEEDSSRG